jgi:heme exporter protein D
MKDFLDMGGYAAYVWPAYAVTLLVLALNVAWARGALTRALAAARRRIGTEARDA